ncbi:MAG: SpoIID/LytB domain-containing protein [Bacteroidales bacterium]
MLISRVFIQFTVLMSLSSSLYSGTFRVNIFSEHSVYTVVISPGRGIYRLVTDGEERIVIGENDVIYVSVAEEMLMLRGRSGFIGSFQNVSFKATEAGSEFSIRPVDPFMERAYYHGSLELSVDLGRIRIVNAVDENIYLAGVVEAESGKNAHDMYYRAQAIICRTYLYGNLSRHEDEGFHLCDGVHCQVYKGILTGDKTVYAAVIETSGKVITQGDSILITAAFHSNCGGQTVNSEDVWLVYRPYLRSVYDPYCSDSRSSSWEIMIDAGKWESYLSAMGLVNKYDPHGTANFAFTQQDRNVCYSSNGKVIPFTKIRSDWNFRSAYFDIEPDDRGEKLLVRGRGSGHGVGLCQEGAMEMAGRGYNFIDILLFYYTDIRISDIDNLL